MKAALTKADSDRVFQVVNLGEEFPVHPAMTWRECANDVTPETHDFDGVAFVLKPGPPPPTAEDLRRAEIDGSIAAETIGTVQPATRAQLQAMKLAQYNAWFDANFDTAAKLIGLLKRLTLIIIRRAL